MGFFKKELDLNTSKNLNDITTVFIQFLQEQKWKVQSNVQGDKAIITIFYDSHSRVYPA